MGACSSCVTTLTSVCSLLLPGVIAVAHLPLLVLSAFGESTAAFQGCNFPHVRPGRTHGVRLLQRQGQAGSGQGYARDREKGTALLAALDGSFRKHVHTSRKESRTTSIALFRAF